MPNACQLIVDPPAEGCWNMAVDEALLGIVAKTGIPTLRFYQWKRPTLSLGYFQRNADRETHPASLNADVVRRLSGGGAILHDQELTYSLILPVNHCLAADTQSLYQTLHRAFLECLDEWLADSTAPWQPVLCEGTAQSKKKEEPFLCFQRRSAGDVLLKSSEFATSAENHKVLGSAQRRTQGSILQHGSLLLGRSTAAPELLGIRELTGIQLAADSARGCLQLAFAKALKVRLESYFFSGSHVKLAEEIAQRRYSNPTWLERR